jgi:hypothetical protein
MIKGSRVGLKEELQAGPGKLGTPAMPWFCDKFRPLWPDPTGSSPRRRDQLAAIPI